MMLSARCAPKSAAPCPPMPTAAMFNFDCLFAAARTWRGSAATIVAAAALCTKVRRFMGGGTAEAGVEEFIAGESRWRARPLYRQFRDGEFGCDGTKLHRLRSAAQCDPCDCA